MSTSRIDQAPPPRRRLTREERLCQLLEVAWQLVRNEGTDALTLGRLAEQAGVTKPVVYDHFGTRAGLLAALYKDFDQRQTASMDAAIEAGEPSLAGRATVIAAAYVDCVLLQGREIPGVIAALASTPELEQTRREYEAVFLDKCSRLFSPFTKSGLVQPASLHAMLGAAEALSNAAANGCIGAAQAKAELFEVIVAMVGRQIAAAAPATFKAGK